MSVIDGLSDDIIEKIKSAKSVTALTGAGVSAESGVPTFRGDEGLWNNYRAEELATPEAFERDPSLVWRWYDWRRTLLAPLKPNPGHETLARFEQRFDKMTLITQNVDGLHRKAGSEEPVEIHGNIWHTQCISEGTVRENRETPLKEIPPRCPDCQALLRPHIVWFGESLEPAILNRAFEGAEKCDLFFVIGTSGMVQPAASLAGVAKRGGATVIEINLEKTPLSYDVDATLLGLSGEALPEIEKIL
ncbi:NAD-dependent protein deacetylase of SIR2 family [hydrothermal vent metagenome]|uniref:NAD-dependent protein deacetylase of SIR2 family n=1 Tax=hydrothermal vent metagenome TaxID=652676 RepID=A0A3B1C8V7_9ZZZZ